VVEGLDVLALGLGRDQRDLGALLLQEMARFGVFRLLHAVRHQDRNVGVFQFGSHDSSCLVRTE
jgi:hypothetical protein